MSTVTSDPSQDLAEQKKRQRPARFLLLSLLLFEVFYGLLIALAPLPRLNLSQTPLGAALPWTLLPAHALQELIGPSLAATTWLASLLLGAVFVGLLGTYAGTTFLLVRRPEAFGQGKAWLPFVLCGTLLLGLTLLFLPTLFSDSVFTSMFTGRILIVYHQNPLTSIPANFPNDPYLPWVISGRDSPNVFGPLWIYICGALATTSNSLVISLFVFKGVALGAHLLNTLLIWAILGKMAPARRLAGTLLYAWCPLALIEIAGSGQGESIQITLLLLATWLYVLSLPATSGADTQEKIKGAPLRLAMLRISTLVVLGFALSANLITLLIAPLALWYGQRHERRVAHALRTVSWQMLLLLIPEVLLMVPLWHGTQTFFTVTSSVDMDHFVHAPVSLLTLPLRLIFMKIANQGLHGLPGILGPELAADLTIRASATCIFVLIYAHQFGRVRRAPLSIAGMYYSLGADRQTLIPGFDSLVDCCSIAIFWYLILVSGWFWPWYILWFFWLIVLRRIDTFTSAILLLSGTALLIYAFVGFSRQPLATYQAALIFGAPLLYLLAVSRSRTPKNMEGIK